MTTLADDGSAVTARLLDWVLTPPGLVTVGVVVALLLTVVLLTGWLGYRAARRHLPASALRGWRDQLETQLAHAQTRALPPGPRRDIAAMRERLRREIDSTRRTVLDGPGDAAGLCARLADAAVQLDGELAVLAREPDDERARAGAATAANRVDDLCRLAGELRDATRHVRAAQGADDTRELHRDVRDETVALQAGIDRLRQLNQ